MATLSAVPLIVNKTRPLDHGREPIETSRGGSEYFLAAQRYNGELLERVDPVHPDAMACAAMARLLRATGDGALAKVADRIENCPTDYKTHSGTGQRVYAPRWRCNERLCPRCNRVAGWRRTKITRECLARMSTPRMFTAGLRSRSLFDLDATLDDLSACLVRLRGRATWRRIVVGAVILVEITRDKRRPTWWPHAHVFIDVPAATPLDLEELKHDWLEIAGTRSELPNISKPIPRSDIKRVAEYPNKEHQRLATVQTLTPGLLLHFARATKGRKTLIRIGNCLARRMKTVSLRPRFSRRHLAWEALEFRSPRNRFRGHEVFDAGRRSALGATPHDSG